MDQVVRIIETSLKIGKLNEDDKKNLETYVELLAVAMSDGGKGADKKKILNEFKELLQQADQDLTTPFSALSLGGKREDFDSLLKDHWKFMNDINSDQVKYHACDSAKQNVSRKYAVRLSVYPLPAHIYEILSRKHQNISIESLLSSLTHANYVTYFQTLLWIEEAHHAVSLRRYDMTGIKVVKHQQDIYKLNVPGLAEGRPSLMEYDKVLLKTKGTQLEYYEGIITKVRLRDVLIRLHSSLTYKVDSLKFDVFFLVNRTPFKRNHYAVTKFSSPRKHILFPIKSLQPMTTLDLKRQQDDIENIPWFSQSLNIQQKKAVINILNADCRPVPYIIFGPPGTGKTVAMVESVLQVHRCDCFKILVCGSSNACTDNLASRILNSNVLPEDKIVRLAASYRMFKHVPPETKAITKTIDEISFNQYKDYSIIVTTCIQSFVLQTFKLKFDYVFIDEAGHASEPESLIPIGLLKKDGCLVLAGDPHQLGPVCMSRTLDSEGIGTSLMERLFKQPVYQRRADGQKHESPFDERYLTKLLTCYRSDARVMAVNNKLFYENDLKFNVVTPKKWLDIFKTKNPLVFQAIKGRDFRDYLNPSWFNANEALMCLTYVKRLYNNGLKPHQLGIITPYRSQIDKLNLLFDLCQLKKCKIATMEEFQGDEREVIIISTVRASVQNIKIDKKLGFLFNRKRFNVAISRAKWLVIALGDPKILCRDENWAEYIKTAQRLSAKQNQTALKLPVK